MVTEEGSIEMMVVVFLSSRHRYTILSFMIGTMFFDIDNGYNQIQDRISMFFYIAAFMVFMAVAVLPFYIQQRAVYIRERANGAYATAPYVLANFTCALPGVFALALICAVIIYFMVGMHSGADRFWIFTIDLFLALVCAAQNAKRRTSAAQHAAAPTANAVTSAL